MNDQLSFGVLLKKARKSRGMTQAALADAAQVHSSYICQLECGQREPSLQNLKRLVIALYVSADYLLGLMED